jgi:hypothetical protein
MRSLFIMLQSNHCQRTTRRNFWTLLSLCLLTRIADASSAWSCSRGGAEPAGNAEHAHASSALTRFLTSHNSCDKDNGDSKKLNAGRFYIQGWRWHTMSLIREAGKLQRLAENMLKTQSTASAASKLSLEPGKALHQASDYIVNFNMKGLHRIEMDLFFPWAIKKVSDAVMDNDVALAFRNMMEQLQQDQKTLVSLGDSLLVSSVDCIMCFFSMPPCAHYLFPSLSVKMDTSRMAKLTSGSTPTRELQRVATTSAAIAGCARSMLQREDAYLVPTIAALVPAKEQKSFNDKVIRNLGLLDSRLYLVGMYQALQDLKDPKELQVFDESIPIIARKMIPWWKRKLYDPRVGSALELP